MIGRLLLTCFLLLPACGGDPTSSATVAVYDLSRIREDMVAVPYPSDLHRDEAGVLRLGALPGDPAGPAYDALREILALRPGFGTTSGAYFAIDGSLDAASLPAGDGIDADPSADDPMLLVDVDAGALLPVRVRAFDAQGLLAVRPAPGIVLARDHAYAVALTTSLHGADGLPISAAPDFLALRDGTAAGPEIEAARSVITPAIDAALALGVPRASLAALVPFTTGDDTAELRQVRTLIRDGDSSRRYPRHGLPR